MEKKRLGLIAAIVVSIIAAGGAFAQGGGAPISRGAFVAKISDYFGWPHPSDYNDIWKVPLTAMKDVSAADNFGKEIEVAVERGIVSPSTEGYFYPNAPMSRQDAAVIVVKAFKVPLTSVDMVSRFADAKTIKPAARDSVNALLAAGFLSGATPTEFKPAGALTFDEADAILAKITSTVVSPVQALPVQNAVAPRRYIKLWTPTPGATIYFTTDGSTPTMSSPVYTVASNGYINEMLSNAQLPERDVVYKAVAYKDGMAVSPVQTFTWRLYRPAVADFQALQILSKTPSSPAVYRICNDSESVRPMAWYIEGQNGGIIFDALQTPDTAKNLKDFIDKNLAQKPYVLVIGHAHGDHTAQTMNFLRSGVDVYCNDRGWSALQASSPFPAVVSDPADQAKIKNVDAGDVFHLGGCDLSVYALPGHENGNIILQDKANGLIFASDIYGCTRAGSADNVAVQQVKADLLLSMAQQVYSEYLKGGGKTTMLFTGHDETPLGDINLKLFEQALQQVVDKGEAGCSPTLRGNNDAPNSRTTLIGDMWKDGTRWISLKLIGTMGDKSEFLTASPINYNGAAGYLKYSVLSNIEFEGGELVGTTLSWQNEPPPFKWAGKMIRVPYSLPNMFDPWTYDYSVKVPAGSKTLTVIPTPMSTKITSMRLNGAPVGYKSPTAVQVLDGSVITIEIVAPDGVTTSTYHFTVSMK